jgi:EAL domain-containing protein (putative c-di-GMP-specific phosphodiesterase class I)
VTDQRVVIRQQRQVILLVALCLATGVPIVVLSGGPAAPYTQLVSIETGIAPGQLVLALPENALAGDPELIGVLTRVRATGVRIAIDDFGSGRRRCVTCTGCPSTSSRSTGRTWTRPR